MGTLRTAVACAGISFLLLCAGCGVVAIPVGGASPSIRQVYPQTITAGSQSATLKVEGANLSSDAVILWNGQSLPTSVVSSNTLAATVQSKDLASPSVVALTVHDSQTGKTSNSLPVTVAAESRSGSTQALGVMTSSLPAGTPGMPYSATLAATGGTAPYTWSITSGALPNGLSLSPSSGVISGTARTSGTFTFTATVTDSASPAATASVSMTLTFAALTQVVPPAAPLAIATTSLPSGSNGIAYAATLAASGGTPAYTWSITSGSLPAGLTLAATTGVISGTPTATGTANLTVAVTDNANPAATQSLATAITIVTAPAAPTGPGATWYVRPDGGTRYSADMTAGQCDGKADAPYPGTGTNQHCAFNDVRFLWQDGSYTTGSTFPGWGWVIAGGDTVIIRGSISTGVSYRIGWDNPTTYCNPATGICFGQTGNAVGSGMPPPPSGSAAQHTRILGENYAACTSQSARTQLHGGWGAWGVINLGGSSYVDLGCLDITDFSNCGKDMDTVPCDSTQDFAHDGLILDNTATHDTLTDIRIHGMASDGIVGSTGDGFVATDLAIVGNADAGWNADLRDGTTGSGSLLVQNFNISWNGCVEEYPIVDAEPYTSCRDDSTGGYGDGFGTATVPSPAPGWQVHFDQGVVYYNTQDGLDALHIGGQGSTMTVTRVLAYGNEGQQLKVGGATATIRNSLIVGNCDALQQNIPGRPSVTNDNLGDTCRAGNTAVLINTTPGDPATFQGNTIYSAGNVGLEVEYATSDTGPTNTLAFNDNVFVGFYNSISQQNAAPIYSNSDLNMLRNPGASWSNNATFGQKSNWACPAAGESNALCTDPGLVDETFHLYGYGNMKPASSTSAVVGRGVAEPALATDYNGVTRPNSPSMGALEP